MVLTMFTINVNRKNEQGSNIPTRSDRFFAVNSQWYFSTREGVSIGPYSDKKEATAGLSLFIEYVTLSKNSMYVAH